MLHNNPCSNHLCLMQNSLLIGCLAIHWFVVGRTDSLTVVQHRDGRVCQPDLLCVVLETVAWRARNINVAV